MTQWDHLMNINIRKRLGIAPIMEKSKERDCDGMGVWSEVTKTRYQGADQKGDGWTELKTM